jgi:phosphoglycerate dehydrogenase-like enzyme
VSDPTVAVHGGRFGALLLDGLSAAHPDVTFVAAGTPESEAGADVLVALPGDPAAIRAALTDGVGWVHVLGAGVDGFPLEAVGERTLTCSRGAAASAIAEFVLATMLAFEKDLPDSWIGAPPPEWNRASLGGLEGRTLGLIGLGAIGSAVASRGRAFDMELLAVRRTEAPPPPGVRLCSDLPTLVGGSDHLVVAAPATPATDRLLDAAVLGAVKPGLHLVNVARGSLVDQDALLAALDDGRIARASLDVVEPEPLPAGHPLYSHPRVRLSPHVSWSSPQTMVRTMQLFVDNLARYRSGSPLLGVVDVAAGY